MAAKKKSAKSARKRAPRVSAWEQEVRAAVAAGGGETDPKCTIALAKSVKSLASILLQQIQETTEGSLRDHTLERLREVVVTSRKVLDHYGVEEETARPTPV